MASLSTATPTVRLENPPPWFSAWHQSRGGHSQRARGLGVLDDDAAQLSAGAGYEYLTRQVDALDSTDKGAPPLADYYVTKGEAPGRWTGSGITRIDGIEAGDAVTADQMKHLFGTGSHPLTGGPLGSPYKVYGNDWHTKWPGSAGHGPLRSSWRPAPRPVPRQLLSAHLLNPFGTHVASPVDGDEFHI